MMDKCPKCGKALKIVKQQDYRRVKPYGDHYHLVTCTTPGCTRRAFTVCMEAYDDYDWSQVDNKPAEASHVATS